MEMIVNTKARSYIGGTISYIQLLHLVEPPRLEGLYTVVYSRGPTQNREGILGPGETVHTREGMVFEAYITDGS